MTSRINNILKAILVSSSITCLVSTSYAVENSHNSKNIAPSPEVKQKISPLIKFQPASIQEGMTHMLDSTNLQENLAVMRWNIEGKYFDQVYHQLQISNPMLLKAAFATLLQQNIKASSDNPSSSMANKAVTQANPALTQGISK
ncbi:MAG: hypothetical protein ACJA0H_000493 [Francisellaceae bacterium]|jgi:hypothetical protein